MAEVLEKGHPVAAEEDVLRALTSDTWDGTRFSSQTFKGANTSVSRLAIYSVRQHWRIFRRSGGVERPPKRTLLKIGQINVARMADIGAAHDVPVDLTVESDPLDWNDAHAIIPQDIKRGLANKLRDALDIHSESAR